MIYEPTAEERAEIKAKHAHRFPEAFVFPKPDGGKTVRLTVILGNPTGSCRMPKDAIISRAWKDAVAGVFSPTGEAFDYEPLVADCVLWPPERTWSEWTERWPALAKSVAPALRKKYGGSFDMMSEPKGEAPPAIAEALAAHPGSTWIRLSPDDKNAIDVAVVAPRSSTWGMFTESIKKRDAESWALALDLTTVCVVASQPPVADAFLRWPGLALLVAQQVHYLAGISTEYERGEL